MYTFVKFAAIFFIYSFLGWCGESIYCTVGETRKAKKFTPINRGFCTGPVCPIYGTTGVVMLLCLGPFADRPWWILAIIGIVVCDVVEYITSYGMEKLFNARWWDYTGKIGNINGRICLRNSVIWGALSVIYIKFVVPFADRRLEMIPHNILYILTGIVLAVFLVDFINTARASLDIHKITTKFQAIRDSFGRPEKSKDLGDTETESRVTDYLRRLSDFSPHRKSKVKRIVRFYPRLSDKMRDQIAELQSVPTEFSDKLSDITDELKNHFGFDDHELY